MTKSVNIDRSKTSARILAANALLRIETDSGSDSGDVVRTLLDVTGLELREARLATSLVFNVLRNQILLDYQYRSFLTQAPSRLSPEVRCVLRLVGAQKLFFERLPDHAIVNEAVSTIRTLRRPAREAAFVNAVARKIVAANGMKLPPEKLPLAERLSSRHSFPTWLTEMLVGKFGTDDAIRVMEQSNREPDLSLRVNILRSSAEELRAEIGTLGMETAESPVVPNCLLVKDTGQVRDLIESAAFKSGKFYIQDEASQMVGHIANPKAGERILDICSAPGGKATHLAELSGGKANVIATDISEGRLEAVRENIARLQTPGIRTIPILELERAESSFDLILVDAPCSGLGTTRRNPEIRYRCSGDKISRLAIEQTGILNRAAALLDAGGRIVYSTCTISDAENAEVVARFLASNESFEAVVDPKATFSQIQSQDGFYRTWPTYPEMDGFEAVVLRRK